MSAPPAVAAEPVRAWETLVRGIRLSPRLRTGLPGTLLLAVVATAGRAIVPVAIQRTIDDGFAVGGAVELATIAAIVAWAGLAVLVTALASGWMNLRLAAVVETALSDLRIRAFRHIHDLSMLHQQSQQRGALVGRVTTDVDEISRFMQWAGLNLITAIGQLSVAVIVMFAYSWRLTLVVLVVFVPFVLLARWFQRRLTLAYVTVREHLGRMLGVIAETVVGAPVVRAYGVERHMQDRLDDAIDNHRRSAVRAGGFVSSFAGSGEMFGALATAGVVVAGVWLGIDGQVTPGVVIAFLFLITLFVDPVLIAGEVVNEGQTAVAGFRRVLDVLEVEPDVVDPGPDGRDLPDGPLGLTMADVSFRYPRPGERAADATGLRALRDIDVELRPGARIAVVGETGSGKTTFAKLVTRLMDPSEGVVRIGGEDLRRVAFTSLRSRVVMVPQDGTLLDGTIADNVRMGREELDDDGVVAVFTALGLGDWVAELAEGVSTRVGERGQSLSSGERQLVALARAYASDPDLLVLDEATSAVDPATEQRIQQAVTGLIAGRTTVVIAHRLSTAMAADEILVFDDGRVVQRGSHPELVAVDGAYAALHASWTTSAGRG